MQENDDDIKIVDVDEPKKRKIEPESIPDVRLEVKPEVNSGGNNPVVNLDSSLESAGSREESKAANNDKQLTIEADNSEMQFNLAKEKYVRPYPEHQQLG